MAVYLLHSTVPLVKANGQEVRHYLGYCDEGMAGRRMHEHLTGRHSARVVQAMLNKGATLWLGNYWPGLTRTDERRMKRNGHLESKCLRCELEALKRKIDALDGTDTPLRPMPTERS
jgi:hypothetical protein